MRSSSRGLSGGTRLHVPQLALELRAMRWSTALISMVLAISLNALFLGSDLRQPLALIGAECLVPILYVPVFASILGEDRRLGVHESTLPLRRVRLLYGRRFLIVALLIILNLIAVGAVWGGLDGGLLRLLLSGISPALALGASAYLMSALGAGEAAVVAAVLGTWAFEQLPFVAHWAATTPVYYVYLSPATQLGGGPIVANKVVLLAVALGLFLLAQLVLSRPERLLHE